ncbi:outer membrane beta-barrel protein [Mucilaginibacter sp. UYCu711]|uniref:outer membrane beta-barrel protein n=1 Tax=Mucilaginibacter sp. UYCu711 TaxID=3156339 RepID=UPI003D1B41BD
MKKIILLTTILLITGTVSAQKYFNGERADYEGYYQPKFGFIIAGNISKASLGTDFSTRTVTGITAGVNLDLPIVYPVSLQPGLMYAQKGYIANTAAGEFTQRSQSIDLPVLAKFHSGSVFNFYLGPQLSYLVSTTNKYSETFATTGRENYQYTGSKFRYQGVVGVGVDVTKHMNILARYAFDLLGTSTNGNSVLPSYRSQAWQIGLGFSFDNNLIKL